jgi:hypothetical protein
VHRCDGLAMLILWLLNAEFVSDIKGFYPAKQVTLLVSRARPLPSYP